MKTHLNHEQIPASHAIHHPAIAQLQAVRATQVSESPASQRPGSESHSQRHQESGISAGGAGPGPLPELSPDYLRIKERLDVAQSTLHQLTDLIDGTVEGVSGYGPASNKNNQRLLKGAVGAAQEIVSHAEAGGEAIIRLQPANIYNKTIPTESQRAIAAYGANAFHAPQKSKDPSLVRQAIHILQLHVAGPNGVLADLQNLAENGPHSSDRARHALGEARNTLVGLQNVIADTQAKALDQMRATGTIAHAKPLDRNL
jgi:hypothetical protein